MGFYFSISTVEWCLVLLATGMVLGSELLNSAIEEWVNLVSPEWNSKAGAIKDMAAAAVLCISVIAGIIGFLIFGKYFIS
jgi:diacylglycerol kinase